MVINFVIAFVLGFLVGFGTYFCIVKANKEDHTYEGAILIDMENSVYRLLLNGQPEDWADADQVVLKVTKSETPLKRLADIPDEEMSLDKMPE